jgi:hypothetical protein
MKLLTYNKKYFLLLTILFSILISNVELKMRHRLHKHKQVVMGKPSAGNTVVSGVTEADELPGVSVINVPVANRATPPTWSVPMRVEHPVPESYGAPVIRGEAIINTVRPAAFGVPVGPIARPGLVYAPSAPLPMHLVQNLNGVPINPPTSYHQIEYKNAPVDIQALLNGKILFYLNKLIYFFSRR